MVGPGDMQSVHYDKRGAKVTITYGGDDCATKKDEVEQAANKLCSDNVAMASVSFLPFSVQRCRVHQGFQMLLISVQTNLSKHRKSPGALDTLRSLCANILMRLSHVSGASTADLRSRDCLTQRPSIRALLRLY